MREGGFDGPVLIDQGTADQFLDLLQARGAGRGHGGAPPARHVPDAEGLRPQLFLHLDLHGGSRRPSTPRRSTRDDALRRRRCLPGQGRGRAGRDPPQADACIVVSNGGLRPSPNPLVETGDRADGPGRGRHVDRRARRARRRGGDRRHPAGREMRRGRRAGAEPQRRGADRGQYRQRCWRRAT